MSFDTTNINSRTVFFDKRVNQTFGIRKNTEGVLIKITTGDIRGITRFIDNKIDIEQGSIIPGININRIEVESILFKGLGLLPINALIYDPPRYTNKDICQCKCLCTSKNKCGCTLNQVESGVVKSFNIVVPPGVDDFIINLVAYRNFRYGEIDKIGNTLKYTNCNSSYKEIYKFSWFVDISKQKDNCVIVNSLGPFFNYEISGEVCLDKTTTEVVQDESITSTVDDIFQPESKKEFLETKTSKEEICIQPFYNNLIVSESNVLNSSALIAANYPAGAGLNTSANINFGICLNKNSITETLGIINNNLILCSTTSAVFIINRNELCSNRIDKSNILFINSLQVYGTLILFTTPECI